MKNYQEEPEEIKEENEIQKILNNKKITIPAIIIVGAIALFLLFNTPREKKEKEVKGSDKINTEELYKKNQEQEQQQQLGAFDPVQNQTFSNPEIENGNLNQGNGTATTPETGNLENPPSFYNPNSVESGSYQYGNYSNLPSSYEQNNVEDESNNSGQNSENRRENKRKSLKVDRGQPVNNQNNNMVTGEQLTGDSGQQQVQATGQQQQNSKTQNRFRLKNKLEKPISQFILQTGAKIPAALSNSIDSDLPGNVRAVVTQDVYDSIRSKYLLIPKGSRLYGIYDNNIIYGQNRLVFIWQRIILPNGMTIDLEAMQGTDITGQVGIRGKVNNHTWKLLRSIVMSSFINLFSSGISVTAQKKLGKDLSAKATIGQNVADEASNNIKNAGDAILERDLNQQPTIRIKSGKQFFLEINADMELYPYNMLVTRNSRMRNIK